jgi:hypothetical protein
MCDCPMHRHRYYDSGGGRVLALCDSCGSIEIFTPGDNRQVVREDPVPMIPMIVAGVCLLGCAGFAIYLLMGAVR